MDQPPYNPQSQGPPYPQQPGNVGFEQYQQGAPPPYSAPAPYPPNQGAYGPGPPGQGAYGPGPPGQGAYGPGPPGQGAYGPPDHGHHGHHGSPGQGSCGPPHGPGQYGSAAHYPAGQNPQTVYVYEDSRRKQKSSDEDTCLAMMAGACAMCLCCSLLSD